MQHTLYDADVEDNRYRVIDIANHYGVAASTIRAYNARNQMPSPDGYDKDGPWWSGEPLQTWKRPGRGRRRVDTGVEVPKARTLAG